MSRLTRRLEEIEAHQRRVGTGKAVEHHLGEAGDAFEFAARVATGAFKARDRNPDESDVFRLGYLTACLELAVVLRCMRAGRTPEPGEMAQARLSAANELHGAALQAAQQGKTAPSIAEKAARVTELLGHTSPAEFIREHPSPATDDEVPDGYCLDHGGPHPCRSCEENE